MTIPQSCMILQSLLAIQHLNSERFETRADASRYLQAVDQRLEAVSRLVKTLPDLMDSTNSIQVYAEQQTNLYTVSHPRPRLARLQ